jgi:HEPN domain-containing protein
LPDGAFYEDLCFHAQQAAEKAIKAVYQKHNLAFRYTHDLGELLAGLRVRGVSIPSEVEDSEILAAYASEYRYPSVTEPVTIEEYQQATHHASKVLQWAEAMIADHPA